MSQQDRSDMGIFGGSSKLLTTAAVAAIGVGVTYFFVKPKHKKLLVSGYKWLWTLLAPKLRPKQVVIVNSREQCSAAVKLLLSECKPYRYFGFDCEWRPQRNRGRPNTVALLQLASPQGSCVLFRLCKIGFVPEEIKVLLRDPTYLKVGVAPLDDAKLLFRDYKASVKGCLDLRNLVSTSRNSSQVLKTSSLSKNKLEKKENKRRIRNSLIVSNDIINKKEESTVENPKTVPEQPTTSTSFSSDLEEIQWIGQDNSRISIVRRNVSFLTKKISTSPGLAKLADVVLGVTLDKNWKITCSDWEADVLSPQQVTYAANDALVSAKIFARLAGLEVSRWPSRILRKSPPKLKQGLHHDFSQVIDINFRSKAKTSTTASLRKPPQPNLKPPSRSYSTRQSPLYDNCCLEAPDGQVLCTCDKKKAMWYIEKGLGELVPKDGDQLVVRLKFEPSGRGGPDRDYYATLKENICVVCGADESYVRKSIVPHEYRAYFPEFLKEHHSHDVLLMCLKCNLHSNTTSQTLRDQLAVLCDAPLITQKFIQHHPSTQVRSAARALIGKSHCLPPSRAEELTTVVASHFGVSITEVTPELLEQASTINPNLENCDYEPHGQRVVRHFQTEHGEREGVSVLERMWRSHFLDVMQPKFLPSLWSINHKRS